MAQQWELLGFVMEPAEPKIDVFERDFTKLTRVTENAGTRTIGRFAHDSSESQDAGSGI